MVEIRKKPKESAMALIRKFSSKIRMSGVLTELRKRQFYTSPLGKKEKKEKALKRLKRQSGK